MERSESPLLGISSDDLREYREEITAYLKAVEWIPEKSRKRGEIDYSFLVESSNALGINEADQLSILKNMVRISDDRIILSNTSNHVLNALRDGFCIGKYLAAQYSKASGLDLLSQKNQSGDLQQSELAEFHDKLQTQSAVLLFGASSYVVHKVNALENEVADSLNLEFNGIPEVVISRPSRSLQCTLYYYAAYLERSGLINSDHELLKITLLYFRGMLDELIFRKDSYKYLDPFLSNHYKLEGSDFLVQGFEHSQRISVRGSEFNRIRMEEIVANKEAKHLFKRYAERLLCYDFETRKNPMNELGGLPAITMADGKPGTGKSMLIAAMATLLQEKCEMLDYNFLFWPLPETIVSTYQGGTAERAMEWFKPMQDPGKIIFAPVDDAENNLEERTRRGVSAGVREFIGVFLRNTEGAYAINYGNRLISLFTNIPDQIDKAVLSRIQMRVSMEGASTDKDFMDQDHLWWSKYSRLDKKFVDASDPKDYKYMDDQQIESSINAVRDSDYTFTNPKVEDIYQKTKEEYDIFSHEFFGNFYSLLQKSYPFFSSRDLRNIQKAVDGRIIDFDLPELWWERPEDFFFKPYEDKLKMLKSLMQENMKGATFTRLRLYEAMNYVETSIRINETGIQRQIKESAQGMYIREQAAKRLSKGDIHD